MSRLLNFIIYNILNFLHANYEHKIPSNKKRRWIIRRVEQTIFLKHFITKDFIEVGDYTYYDQSFGGGNPEEFENNNVLYFGLGQKLKIGKFCSLAASCKFIMKGAQHTLNSTTTYPLFWNFVFDLEVKTLFDKIPDDKYYNKEYSNTIIGNNGLDWL